MRRCDDSPPGELLRAFGEFNRGEWFRCHETLELIWMGAEGETGDFYKGVLQVAVGLHHWSGGNFGGAVRVLASATGYLRRVRPVCQRIDVEGLADSAERFREALMTLGPERMRDLPAELVPRLVLVKSEELPGSD